MVLLEIQVTSVFVYFCTEITLSKFILYWERPNIKDKKVDFNTSDVVLIYRENKTALVLNTAVNLTHTLLKTETEKITKYHNLAMEIKSISKVNIVSIHPFVISVEKWSRRTS